MPLKTVIHAPEMPYSILLFLLLVVIIVCLHVFFRRTKVVVWMGSVGMSLAVTVCFGVLGALSGLVQQQDTESSSWLNHIAASWPFVIIILTILINLGLVVMRRLYPFKKKNLGFLLNHLGLWLVIAGMFFGSGDLVRLKSILELNQFVTFGFNGDDAEFDKPVPLPFSLMLKEFRMEEHVPGDGRPKFFRSEVMYGDRNSIELLKMKTGAIEVNSPLYVNGWRIYQSGYDIGAKGKSRISLVELVRDPWLPVVYAGFWMILIGVVDLFFRGRSLVGGIADLDPDGRA